MADRYWVGGTANWDATAGTKWATTSGGVGGQTVPTAADDVFFDASSGAGNCSIPTGTTVTCRSLDFTGYTGTFTIASTTSTLNIGTTTPGPGNVALKLSATMTWTNTGLGTTAIQFVSTSTTQQTITTAGKTMPAITFTGAGGSWILSDSLTAAATTTLTTGTFNTGNQALTLTAFSSINTNVRTLTLGSSAISCSGTGGFQAGGTNLTMTANTAVITTTSTGSTTIGSGSSAGFNWNGTSFVFSNGPTNAQIFATAGTTNTFANLTFTGAAVKGGTLILNGGNVTVTGTFAINGNSAINRVLVCSSGIGTARTITSAANSFSSVDFRDITGAGAGSWNLAAITGLSGDCGGNSGITFTSPTTQSVAGTASFTWSTATWTSRVPLPQDTAAINNAFIAGRTVTMDMPRVGTIDFTGSTGNVAYTQSIACEIYGSNTFRTGMGNISIQNMTFLSPTTQTYTLAGNTHSTAATITSGRSVLQFNDTFNANIALQTSGSGTFNTQNLAITCRSMSFANTSNTSVLGTSTISYGQTTGVALNLNSLSGASSATFVYLGTSAGTTQLGSATIAGLTWTAVVASVKTLPLAGPGTIGTLTLGDSRTVTITSGTTVTIGTSIVGTGTVINDGMSNNGTTANYASTPSTAALSFTGDFTLAAKVKLTDWTPAQFVGTVTKYSNAASQRGYALFVLPAGNLALYWGDSSTTNLTATSSVATGFVDGTTRYIAASLDVDNGASGRTAKFYTSTDGITWAQLGTTQTTAGVTSVFATANAVTLGGETGATSSVLVGTIYSAQIWSGVRDMVAGTGGTLLFDADLSTKVWGADTFTESAVGATVTITGDVALSSDGALRIRSSTPGSAATLSKASGAISVTKASIRDSTASGGATFNAIDSYSVSNNTGWNFIASSNGNFLQLFE